MQYVPEMPFAKDHDVVKAFPPDRADEPFTISVLPGRTRSGWPVPDAHRPEPALEYLAIGAVTITDDVLWRQLPTHCLGQLPGDPFR